MDERCVVGDEIGNGVGDRARLDDDCGRGRRGELVQHRTARLIARGERHSGRDRVDAYAAACEFRRPRTAAASRSANEAPMPLVDPVTRAVRAPQANRRGVVDL